MGVVYRARDVRLNRDVAIKILPDSAVSDATAVARFRFEAQAASALNHPHIPEIVHRDLKPDNIMITRDGYAKILDFGLAKLTDAGHVDSDETTPVIPTTVPGALVGTPNYMSPEQLHGAEVGPRSDIFSFGSVAYETLSGRRAFGGAMLAETVHQITAVDPPPLRSVDERIPPELQRVVSRCLAKKPAARFPNMREVVAELKRVRERMRETIRRFPRLVQLTFAHDRAVPRAVAGRTPTRLCP
jgi:serine/threonine protein kinase